MTELYTVDPTPGAPATTPPVEPVFDHNYHPSTPGPFDRLIWALHKRLVELEMELGFREKPKNTSGATDPVVVEPAPPVEPAPLEPVAPAPSMGDGT